MLDAAVGRLQAFNFQTDEKSGAKYQNGKFAKYQNETNKSINGTNIEVLIENKIPEQNKLFGRNKYFNSVIADGDEKHIGKLVKVNINNFNRNTLFGKITNLNNKAA